MAKNFNQFMFGLLCVFGLSESALAHRDLKPSAANIAVSNTPLSESAKSFLIVEPAKVDEHNLAMWIIGLEAPVGETPYTYAQTLVQAENTFLQNQKSMFASRVQTNNSKALLVDKQFQSLCDWRQTNCFQDLKAQQALVTTLKALHPELLQRYQQLVEQAAKPDSYFAQPIMAYLNPPQARLLPHHMVQVGYRLALYDIAQGLQQQDPSAHLKALDNLSLQLNVVEKLLAGKPISVIDKMITLSMLHHAWMLMSDYVSNSATIMPAELDKMMALLKRFDNSALWSFADSMQFEQKGSIFLYKLLSQTPENLMVSASSAEAAKVFADFKKTCPVVAKQFTSPRDYLAYLGAKLFNVNQTINLLANINEQEQAAIALPITQQRAAFEKINYTYPSEEGLDALDKQLSKNPCAITQIASNNLFGRTLLSVAKPDLIVWINRIEDMRALQHMLNFVLSAKRMHLLTDEVIQSILKDESAYYQQQFLGTPIVFDAVTKRLILKTPTTEQNKKRFSMSVLGNQ